MDQQWVCSQPGRACLPKTISLEQSGFSWSPLVNPTPLLPPLLHLRDPRSICGFCWEGTTLPSKVTSVPTSAEEKGSCRELVRVIVAYSVCVWRPANGMSAEQGYSSLAAACPHPADSCELSNGQRRVCLSQRPCLLSPGSAFL